jgi:hypothetical protein
LPDAPGVLPNRLKRQSQSARDRARPRRRTARSRARRRPRPRHIEAELTRLATLIKRLDVTWDDTLAADARNILIDAFTLAPRERSVIDAHIHYNRWRRNTASTGTSRPRAPLNSSCCQV